MFRTYQTAIREPGTVDKSFAHGKIKQCKFYIPQNIRVKNAFKCVFLVKSAEWFAIFSNTRGSGSRRLINIQ